MNKIYMVTCGIYSDYREFGFYSTKEKAEEVIKILKENNNTDVNDDVVEVIVDSLEPSFLRTHDFYYISMERNGDIIFVSKGTKESYYENNQFYITECSIANYKRSSTGNCLSMSVYAHDKQHAVKIVNEKRIQLIANGEWE